MALLPGARSMNCTDASKGKHFRMLSESAHCCSRRRSHIGRSPRRYALFWDHYQPPLLCISLPSPRETRCSPGKVPEFGKEADCLADGLSLDGIGNYVVTLFPKGCAPADGVQGRCHSGTCAESGLHLQSQSVTGKTWKVRTVKCLQETRVTRTFGGKVHTEVGQEKLIQGNLWAGVATTTGPPKRGSQRLACSPLAPLALAVRIWTRFGPRPMLTHLGAITDALAPGLASAPSGELLNRMDGSNKAINAE